jgi:DNA-binding protein H-NS
MSLDDDLADAFDTLVHERGYENRSEVRSESGCNRLFPRKIRIVFTEIKVRMAAQNYAELQKRIADLQSQANKLRSEEVAGVVSRIKEAISKYGLTPQDLFGEKSDRVKVRGKAKSASRTRGASATNYADGKGGQWSGLGRRPKWLHDALAAGGKLGDFLVSR